MEASAAAIRSSLALLRHEFLLRDANAVGTVTRREFSCAVSKSGGEPAQVEMLADQFMVDGLTSDQVDYRAFMKHLNALAEELSPRPAGPARAGRYEDVEASCSPATPAHWATPAAVVENGMSAWSERRGPSLSPAPRPVTATTEAPTTSGSPIAALAAAAATVFSRPEPMRTPVQHRSLWADSPTYAVSELTDASPGSEVLNVSGGSPLAATARPAAGTSHAALGYAGRRGLSAPSVPSGPPQVDSRTAPVESIPARTYLDMDAILRSARQHSAPRSPSQSDRAAEDVDYARWQAAQRHQPTADTPATTGPVTRVPPARVSLATVFSALDVEGRAMLSADDVALGLQERGVRVGQEEIDALFESVGADPAAGTRIAFADFCTVISRMRPECAREMRCAGWPAPSEQPTHHRPLKGSAMASTLQEGARAASLEAEEHRPAAPCPSPWVCGVEDLSPHSPTVRGTGHDDGVVVHVSPGSPHRASPVGRPPLHSPETPQALAGPPPSRASPAPNRADPFAALEHRARTPSSAGTAAELDITEEPSVSPARRWEAAEYRPNGVHAHALGPARLPSSDHSSHAARWMRPTRSSASKQNRTAQKRNHSADSSVVVTAPSGVPTHGMPDTSVASRSGRSAGSMRQSASRPQQALSSSTDRSVRSNPYALNASATSTTRPPRDAPHHPVPSVSAVSSRSPSAVDPCCSSNASVDCIRLRLAPSHALVARPAHPVPTNPDRPMVAPRGSSAGRSASTARRSTSAASTTFSVHRKASPGTDHHTATKQHTPQHKGPDASMQHASKGGRDDFAALCSTLLSALSGMDSANRGTLPLEQIRAGLRAAVAAFTPDAAARGATMTWLVDEMAPFVEGSPDRHRGGVADGVVCNYLQFVSYIIGTGGPQWAQPLPARSLSRGSGSQGGLSASPPRSHSDASTSPPQRSAFSSSMSRSPSTSAATADPLDAKIAAAQQKMLRLLRLELMGVLQAPSSLALAAALRRALQLPGPQRHSSSSPALVTEKAFRQALVDVYHTAGGTTPPWVMDRCVRLAKATMSGHDAAATARIDDALRRSGAAAQDRTLYCDASHFISQLISHAH